MISKQLDKHKEIVVLQKNGSLGYFNKAFFYDDNLENTLECRDII